MNRLPKVNEQNKRVHRIEKKKGLFGAGRAAGDVEVERI